MKLLFDLFPVILFFASFKYAEKNPELAADWIGQITGAVTPAQAPILLATVVVIVATLGQIAWVALRHGKVDKMLWVSLVLVVGFGSMTLIFRDEAFIKWKPSVLYWVMAGGLLLSNSLFGKNGIRAMLGDKIELPEFAWQRLNLAWIAFFTGMGGLNLFVAYTYSTDTWVNFKLFGGMGLMLLFVIAQALYLGRYMKTDEAGEQ